MIKSDTVFAAIDTGLASMPEEIVGLRAAVQRLDAAGDALAPPDDTGALEESIAAALARTARESEPVVDVDALLAAEREQARYRYSVRVVARARALAQGQLHDALVYRADEIIREHLAPVFDDVVAKARATASDYLPLGNTPAALMNAPPKARAAYLAMGALAEKFGTLREVRAQLVRRTADDRLDDFGDFALVRNTEQVWPQVLQLNRRQAGLRQPWNEAGSARGVLEWLAQHPEAVAWLPTAEQQDQRWTEVFGERVEEMRRNRHAAEGFLAVGGGRR